jgi:hypothetical protein
MEYGTFRTRNFEIIPAIGSPETRLGFEMPFEPINTIDGRSPDFSQTSEPAYASPISASWSAISPEMLELMHALATRFNRLG